MSALAIPVLIPVAVVALVLMGRRAAAWWVVPVLWPSTQWYYTSLAMPATTLLAGFVVAVPVPVRGDARGRGRRGRGRLASPPGTARRHRAGSASHAGRLELTGPTRIAHAVAVAQPSDGIRCYRSSVTPITLDVEPACPAGDDIDPVPDAAARPRLRAERRPLDAIAPGTWDALAAANPWATPFSGWAFQRAWWDAYGANAHDETLGSSAPMHRPTAPRRPVAIVPLMHRHEVEPGDAADPHDDPPRHRRRPDAGRRRPPRRSSSAPRTTPTTRRSSRRRPTCRPSPTPLADYLADADRPPAWDVVDLRRLRCGDPAADALGGGVRRPRDRARAGRSTSSARTSARSSRCPTAPTSTTTSPTLGKKERHEIRRKVRRAEAVGEIRLDDSTDPLADLEAFIDLHQRRWGAAGLFPPTRRAATRAGSSSGACSSWPAPTARSASRS